MPAKFCQNMSKIVFIAATQREAAPLLAAFDSCSADERSVEISSIGTLAAALSTIGAIERHGPKLVVNFGIAGAIDPDLLIGQVVVVRRDYIADLGAWRAESQRFEPFESELYLSDFEVDSLCRVSSQTVSTACTPMLAHCNQAQIETMEGAAVMAACRAWRVPCVQIRSISNYVGQPRDQWQIGLAVENLTAAIIKIFNNTPLL